MRITNIRNKDGHKLSHFEMVEVVETLNTAFNNAGFETEVYRINETTISISKGHFACFTINPKKLGYNAKVGPYVRSKKGYKRTTVPLWEERVNFNNLLNSELNQMNVVCRIKGGKYLIRDQKQNYVENDWLYFAVEGEADNIEYNGFFNVLGHKAKETDLLKEPKFLKLENLKVLKVKLNRAS